MSRRRSLLSLLLVLVVAVGVFALLRAKRSPAVTGLSAPSSDPPAASRSSIEEWPDDTIAELWVDPRGRVTHDGESVDVALLCDRLKTLPTGGAEKPLVVVHFPECAPWDEVRAALDAVTCAGATAFLPRDPPEPGAGSLRWGAERADRTTPTVAVVMTADEVPPFTEAIQSMVQGRSWTHAEDSLEGREARWPCVRWALELQEPVAWVAVGPLALKVLASAELDSPVVFMMVATPERSLPEPRPANIAGVVLNLDVEKQLRNLREVLPEAKRIGVLHDPDQAGSAAAVQAALASAPELDFTIVAATLESSTELEVRLDALLNEDLDALWLLPDRTVLQGGDPAARDLIALACTRAGVPLVGFAPKYLEAGALFASSVDYADIGAQTGDLVDRLLAGESPQDIEDQTARKAVLSLNLRLATELGLTIPSSAEQRATEVLR